MPSKPDSSIPGPVKKGAVPEARPDTEVPVRRTFSAAYKLEILEKADACRAPGEVGALLRREGLYSSHLSTWRRARREGTLGALGRRRGPRKRRDATSRENERLKAENAKLRDRLAQAEAIIEIQKKASEMLQIPLSRPERDGCD